MCDGLINIEGYATEIPSSVTTILAINVMWRELCICSEKHILDLCNHINVVLGWFRA